jgi:hypothetical protein
MAVLDHLMIISATLRKMQVSKEMDGCNMMLLAHLKVIAIYNCSLLILLKERRLSGIQVPMFLEKVLNLSSVFISLMDLPLMMVSSMIPILEKM